ncbi:hypothetical protein F5X99DRAFT_388656 [Biscogniauxia marginata]|nr:hypothetical protein F5X99DRAFT_388656 [Biscogniauxia marginata]
MGWLWATPPSKGSKSAPSGSSASNQNNNKPAEPAANNYGDPELAKFVAEIQAQFGGGGSGSSSNNNKPSPGPSQPNPPSSTSSPGTDNNKQTPSSSSSSSSSSWSSLFNPSSPSTAVSSSLTTSSSQSQSESQSPSPPPLDPLAESLLPTSMSCRQSFDLAFHCNSLGGQWASVYRSGAVRSCSHHWDDFWFCMRARAYSGRVKEDAVRDYYRRKEVAKYGPGRPSSTDVWEARTERLEPGAAFAEPYDMPDVSDEEWRRLEIERRRQIRDMLDRDEDGAVGERAMQ